MNAVVIGMDPPKRSATIEVMAGLRPVIDDEQLAVLEFRGLNAGIRSSGWKQALQAFTIYFEGRIPTP